MIARTIVRIAFAAWLGYGGAMLLAGTLDPIRASIGIGELIASVLWAIPRTRKLGGVGLLVVFAAAFAVHAHEGVIALPLIAFAAVVTLDLVIRDRR